MENDLPNIKTWIDNITGREMFRGLDGREYRLPNIKEGLDYSKPADRELRELIFTRDHYGCFGCDCRLEIEHIRPRSKGGSHHPNNLRTSCHICNNHKGVIYATQKND
jgi:hypothetical protein